MSSIIPIAIVQARPVYLDLAASLDKACALIESAASQGARLIVFGETWLTGYPLWLDYCPDAALWNHEPTKEVFALLRQQSIVIPSQASRRLAQLARTLGIVLVIGANERVDSGPGNGTLYNSLFFFDSNGELVNHHRKLVPTFTERLVWGSGDSNGLHACQTVAGKLSGLICWEHWMPLARQALHVEGEQIHIAVWPTVNEMHQIASRHYAFEGRCYVIAAGLIMNVEDLPAGLSRPKELAQQPDRLLLRGGSAIIAPDGQYISAPRFDTEEIIIAEIDLHLIDKEKMTLDVTGHYHRPDLFTFQVQAGTRANGHNSTTADED